MEIKNSTPLPKEKSPIGRTPKFSVEYYMMMAKQVVEDGITFRRASEIYNCSHGTVNHWVKLYRSGVLPSKVKKAKRDAATIEKNNSNGYTGHLKEKVHRGAV